MRPDLIALSRDPGFMRALQTESLYKPPFDVPFEANRKNLASDIGSHSTMVGQNDVFLGRNT